ncbi:LppU/SCO3897 family protein [Yinghuangia aomiensis]
MSNPFANGPQGPAGQQPQGQPYGQQPYGQQPPQQPYGQVPPQGYYGAPQPPQPQRKPWLKYLRIAVPVIVVVIAVIGYFASKKDSTAEAAKVGDCMEHVKKSGKDDIKSATCGTPQGQYTVVGKFSGTTNSDKCSSVAEWKTNPGVSFYYQDGGDKFLLCLNPNASAPDPYEVEAG